MKKLILTLGLTMSMFAVNAQKSQIGILNLDKKETMIPVDFWYVVDSKDMKNQMFYYNETGKTKEHLKNLLAEYGQSSESPFGTDEVGDQYWIVTHPSGNIVYLYFSEEDETGFSMIISVTQ
jgi:hypothetical protein